ncbi:MULTISPECIES: chaplin [unclassified Streptomyces]|uniref:chaplin n=1 Tax=unclassified Streptomyces TaxID=2593676 RepID=UPI002DD7E378|nr:chaplin [Streptomyces sp. NBC_01445]
MRQVTRKGLITVAAATGVLAVSGGYAHADSGAEGGSSGSPGVLSGNTIQLPVDVPVNACGNTVNVVGLLNPTAGNDCANTSKPGGGHPGGSHHGGGATAEGGTSDSPGVGSGNHVQVPVHVPVNACGNSVSVIGLLNPAGGNDCANSPGGDEPTTPPTKPPTQPEPNTPAPPKPVTPSTPNHPGTQTVTQPEGSEQLAETGSSMPLGTVLPAGAGALLAGALLYRRARAGV